MKHDNNVSVQSFTGKTTVSLNSDSVSKYDDAKRVESIAHSLCEKFGDTKKEWFPFYCKVAYQLSESRIWQHFEHVTTNKKVAQPMKLFYWLCDKDMKKL